MEWVFNKNYFSIKLFFSPQHGQINRKEDMFFVCVSLSELLCSACASRFGHVLLHISPCLSTLSHRKSRRLKQKSKVLLEATENYLNQRKQQSPDKKNTVIFSSGLPCECSGLTLPFSSKCFACDAGVVLQYQTR